MTGSSNRWTAPTHRGCDPERCKAPFGGEHALACECVCGDWRKHHADGGEGPCRICPTSTAPWDRCHRFRAWGDPDESHPYHPRRAREGRRG